MDVFFVFVNDFLHKLILTFTTICVYFQWSNLTTGAIRCANATVENNTANIERINVLDIELKFITNHSVLPSYIYMCVLFKLNDNQLKRVGRFYAS